MEAIEYAFDNLQTYNGLLYWGIAATYDASTDTVYGNFHGMKGNHPYYELMWDVDPEFTREFIESFWASHILDWSNLDMNRYGPLDRLSVPKGWDHEYKGGPVFFKSKNAWGVSFDTTASDLYHAAAFLFKVSGQEEPLIWGKRLAHRYVETRNPKTGISAWVYSYNGTLMPPPVDESGNWIFDLVSAREDPAYREALLGRLVLSPGVFTCEKEVYVCQLMLGEMLGDDGKEFKQWSLEELTALGRVAYRQKDNLWIPMRTDGTSLEGVKGNYAWIANPADFWAYALAYRMTDDQFMWQMARNIGRGNGFGDIGTNHEHNPSLRLHTDCSNPCAILGFLELYRGTQEGQFLKMARRIGNNILAVKFHKGFFVPSKKHTYAKFDAIESIVLLNLYTAVRPGDSKPPQVWPSRVHFRAAYRQKEQATDNGVIYTLMESVEPPVSLDEAVIMGNLELVKSLISRGTDVDAKDRLGRTALCQAAKNGHKDVVEILLARGAEINVRDSFGASALHYTAQQSHKDIAELLIVNGADVNTKNNNGQTPVNVALRQNRKDIVNLLITKGADVSLHTASFIGDLQRVEKLIDGGTDVDTKNQEGQTALHHAAKGAEIGMVEFLIAKGADINARGQYYYTPMYYAAWSGSTEVVEFLVEKGADINVKDEWGGTPLHYMAQDNVRDMAEFLIVKGADVNAKDNNGKTALSVAKEKGYTEIVKLLRKHGAKE